MNLVHRAFIRPSELWSIRVAIYFLREKLNIYNYSSYQFYLAGYVALCYDCFSEKPKISNVELG